MSLVAEVTITHEHFLLASALAAVPEIDVVVDYDTVSEEGDRVVVFTATCEDPDDVDVFERFDAALAEDVTVDEFSVLSERDGWRAYQMTVGDHPILFPEKAASLKVRLLEITSYLGGWRVEMEVRDLDDLQAFRDYCAEHGVEFQLLSLANEPDARTDGSALTASQREILLTAHELGYFEEPRGASLEEIADELGISSSAASGRLRRAMDALVVSTLLDDA